MAGENIRSSAGQEDAFPFDTDYTGGRPTPGPFYAWDYVVELSGPSAAPQGEGPYMDADGDPNLDGGPWDRRKGEQPLDEYLRQRQADGLPPYNEVSEEGIG